MAIPVFSIVGRSGSGKTTLLENLIPEMRRRGYRVAVIKHHPHPGAALDVEGKDTWRLAQVGADHVVLVAPDQVMHRRRVEREPSLAEVVAEIRDVDLILTEGFKQGDAPKIQVSRGEVQPELVCPPDKLVAVVSDQRLDVGVPQFDPEDVGGLADLIVEVYGLAGS
ncbi:MAG TPA: molybdopterin-guanine dinucleotide biosynthesis protein B [Anaerolineales bacterium]|nr:molybdopterin-guanine dinucleotide biosynthesis protein B [Anaerolineales bacterium]